jgi:hypothetical protein
VLYQSRRDLGLERRRRAAAPFDVVLNEYRNSADSSRFDMGEGEERARAAEAAMKLKGWS